MLVVVTVLVELLRDKTEHGNVDSGVEHEEEEDELLASGEEHLTELVLGENLLWWMLALFVVCVFAAVFLA